METNKSNTLRPNDFKQATVYVFNCPYCGKRNYEVLRRTPEVGDQIYCSFCGRVIHVENEENK